MMNSKKQDIVITNEETEKSKQSSRWRKRKESDTDYIELNKRIAPLSNILGTGSNIAESNIQSRI